MAAGSKFDNEDMITEINVTPLVDVMLVLLVIFMISAPVIYQSAVKVDLPEATTGENTEKVTLRFSITKNGEYLLADKPVKKSELPEVIESALKKDPTANAIIGADKRVTHGQVVALIDALKVGGIKKVAIGTESRKGEKK